MAWRTLNRQVVQMDRPLVNLYKEIIDLHFMSLIVLRPQVSSHDPRASSVTR
jgi:hypothetical protein